MAPRPELQTLFEELIGNGNVYFQPPENISMKYPCIMYEREYIQTDHADNEPYMLSNRYLVTVIDRNPDSVIPDKIAALRLCAFDRFFKADNLNHTTFKLFF